ncbi:MAG: SOS response-associated peptidase [Longimicrobiales bacterium]
MCGRYSLRVSTAELEREFGADGTGCDWTPRYNVAPTQDVVIVRRAGSGARLSLVRWGLVPPWADTPSTGSAMINARAETLTSRAAFRDAFASRRCLIPADAFYEWRRLGRRKQPYRIHAGDDELLAFAGIWDRWAARDGAAVISCAIVTTDAAELVAPLHDRMPAILGRDERERWLHRDTPVGELLDLLRPFAGRLQAHPVSTLINSPDNDGPECAEPDTDALDAAFQLELGP